jgi:hypothetical protein
MKRQADINTLIQATSKQIEDIRNLYKNNLELKDVSPDLKVAIKNYLENLRSALDYLAVEIYEAHCATSEKVQVFFPILKRDASKSYFDNFMKGRFPKLNQSKPGLYNKLESYQYFTDRRNEWLVDFNTLVNESKHLQLVPQKKKELKRLILSHGNASVTIDGRASVNIGEGASFSVGGATIEGGQTLSPNAPFIRADPRLNVRKETWIDFTFPSIQKSALPFLENLRPQIVIVILDIAQLV